MIPVLEFASWFDVPCPDCRQHDPCYTVTFVGERGDEGVIISCNDCGRTRDIFRNVLTEKHRAAEPPKEESNG